MVEIEGVDPMMIASNLKPKYVTHPGEVIMDEIEYMQITQKEFAERIGVSCSQVNQILKGKRPVNTEFALLTEAATGIPADLLLRMQTRYDRIKAENKADFMEKLKKIKKFAAAL
jgi:addiction module HigA family antidote